MKTLYLKDDNKSLTANNYFSSVGDFAMSSRLAKQLQHCTIVVVQSGQVVAQGTINDISMVPSKSPPTSRTVNRARFWFKPSTIEQVELPTFNRRGYYVASN